MPKAAAASVPSKKAPAAKKKLPDQPKAALAPMPAPLADLIASLAPEPDYRWAAEHWKQSVIHLIRSTGAKRLLEIGGGRNPSFSADEAKELGIQLTVNDISAEELARAPKHVEKRCFDICTPHLPEGMGEGSYDLIFSHMVFEHLPSAARAYANLAKLLAPHGVAINHIPTLYCPPLLVNHLLPERLTRALLYRLRPHRSAEGEPKFPAYYDWCWATQRTEQKLYGMGFADVAIVPFYGYGYLENIPFVKTLDAAFNHWAKTRDVRLFASSAYVLMRKDG